MIIAKVSTIETLNLFFVIYFVNNFLGKKTYIKVFLSTVVLIPIIILLLSQPDLGQTLLIISVWLAIIFVSGINLFLFAISYWQFVH